MNFIVECVMDGAKEGFVANWKTEGSSNAFSPNPEKIIEGKCDQYYTMKWNVSVPEMDLGKTVLSCSYQQESFEKTINLDFYVFNIQRVEAASFCEVSFMLYNCFC